MEIETEVLTITLTERDKRNLKVLAACRGQTMREIVRSLIRDEVDSNMQEVARVGAR